ncbi:MAG: hypothetical protein TR69_WS6001000920 [candidate division WS6 bacterium OLB20]|uniref:Uncharacterized protein n=1 Tax=candidate division WS6 bacterium OLB20 TaxID=1617426 RepID=A0A136LZ23_9BACT|nr:MAG: hypothetical protein TR69_WS6001000920 [candidate division WS6 bacterium OLB20]
METGKFTHNNRSFETSGVPVRTHQFIDDRVWNVGSEVVTDIETGRPYLRFRGHTSEMQTYSFSDPLPLQFAGDMQNESFGSSLYEIYVDEVIGKLSEGFAGVKGAQILSEVLRLRAYILGKETRLAEQISTESDPLVSSLRHTLYNLANPFNSTAMILDYNYEKGSGIESALTEIAGKTDSFLVGVELAVRIFDGEPVPVTMIGEFLKYRARVFNTGFEYRTNDEGMVIPPNVAIDCLELFENSRRYGTAQIFSARTAGDHIQLVWADNGKGIPMEQAGEVFKKGVSSRGSDGEGLYYILRNTVSRGGMLDLLSFNDGAGIHPYHARISAMSLMETTDAQEYRQLSQILLPHAHVSAMRSPYDLQQHLAECFGAEFPAFVPFRDPDEPHDETQTEPQYISGTALVMTLPHGNAVRIPATSRT